MKSLITRLLWGIAVATTMLTAVSQQADATVIANYTFDGTSATSIDTELNSTAADFTKNPTSADWGFSSISNNVFARSSATTASEATAITAGDYFSFMVTPNAGSELDLTALNFDAIHNLTAGGSAVTTASMNFFVRSSQDSFAANIGPTYTQAWDTTAPQTVDLSSAVYQDIQVPTEFRMYLYDSGVDTDQNGVPEWTMSVSKARLCRPARR